jgi:hypothetical protein
MRRGRGARWRTLGRAGDCQAHLGHEHREPHELGAVEARLRRRGGTPRSCCARMPADLCARLGSTCSASITAASSCGGMRRVDARRRLEAPGDAGAARGVGVAARDERAHEERLPEQHAEGEHVDAPVDGAAGACSGAMYASLPTAMPCCVRSWLSAARAMPKVRDLHRALGADEHVLRRHVAVDDLQGLPASSQRRWA